MQRFHSSSQGGSHRGGAPQRNGTSASSRQEERIASALDGRGDTDLVGATLGGAVCSCERRRRPICAVIVRRVDVREAGSHGLGHGLLSIVLVVLPGSRRDHRHLDAIVEPYARIQRDHRTHDYTGY